jgi:hypothetical protein
MANQLAFLHTSPVHVATFDSLVRQADPSLRVDHHVREDLLALARELGSEHPDVVRRVHEAMRAAAEAGASLVVCTCSTIGGIAENMPGPTAFEAMRIDRAMADRAVRPGGVVLVVAALRSTVGPTLDLLRDSAHRLGARVELVPLCVEEAWAFFERGDRTAYLQAIADAITAATRSPSSRVSVVVLAQASMAPVVDLLAGTTGVEVLASPRLGVAAALERIAGS